MPARYEKIGALVQRGVLLFSGIVPIPAPALIGAVGAAVISKILEIRERRITEILSSELGLAHVAYLEPKNEALLDFYRINPVYPDLAHAFATEINSADFSQLRRLYPFLYNALILKRKIPAVLFHEEIEQKRYRELTEKYEQLSRGYRGIEGNAELERKINHFAGQLLEVILEAYDAAKGQIKTKDNRFAFDLIDFIREAAAV